MSLKISAAVYSDIGHRSNNEDNFYFNGLYMKREQMNKGGRIHAVKTDDTQLYAVCDGMGGAELGEEASLKAVEMLREYQQSCKQPDSSAFLDEEVGKISDAVDAISLSRGMASGDCGSTIAMLALKDWYFRTVHVGDSRVYLFRRGELRRITRDDSEVQMMVDQGLITLDQAWQHPRKNVITKHLGMPLNPGEKLKPTIGARGDLLEGDRFVICSDGLSDQVHDSVIRTILSETATAQDAATTLVQNALSNAAASGIASDNVTVMVIDVLRTGGKADNAKRLKRMQLLRGALYALGGVSVAGLVWALYNFLTYSGLIK